MHSRPDFTLGHRERCGFTRTGRPAACDCGYVKDLERRFKERWDTSYWAPGSPVFEHYRKR